MTQVITHPRTWAKLNDPHDHYQISNSLTISRLDFKIQTVSSSSSNKLATTTTGDPIRDFVGFQSDVFAVSDRHDLFNLIEPAIKLRQTDSKNKNVRKKLNSTDASKRSVQVYLLTMLVSHLKQQFNPMIDVKELGRNFRPVTTAEAKNDDILQDETFEKELIEFFKAYPGAFILTIGRDMFVSLGENTQKIPSTSCYNSILVPSHLKDNKNLLRTDDAISKNLHGIIGVGTPFEFGKLERNDILNSLNEDPKKFSSWCLGQYKLTNTPKFLGIDHSRDMRLAAAILGYYFGSSQTAPPSTGGGLTFSSFASLFKHNDATISALVKSSYGVSQKITAGEKHDDSSSGALTMEDFINHVDKIQKLLSEAGSRFSIRATKEKNSIGVSITELREQKRGSAAAAAAAAAAAPAVPAAGVSAKVYMKVLVGDEDEDLGSTSSSSSSTSSGEEHPGSDMEGADGSEYGGLKTSSTQVVSPGQVQLFSGKTVEVLFELPKAGLVLAVDNSNKKFALIGLEEIKGLSDSSSEEDRRIATKSVKLSDHLKFIRKFLHSHKRIMRKRNVFLRTIKNLDEIRKLPTLKDKLQTIWAAFADDQSRATAHVLTFYLANQ